MKNNFYLSHALLPEHFSYISCPWSFVNYLGARAPWFEPAPPLCLFSPQRDASDLAHLANMIRIVFLFFFCFLIYIFTKWFTARLNKIHNNPLFNFRINVQFIVLNQMKIDLLEMLKQSDSKNKFLYTTVFTWANSDILSSIPIAFVVSTLSFLTKQTIDWNQSKDLKIM